MSDAAWLEATDLLAFLVASKILVLVIFFCDLVDFDAQALSKVFDVLSVGLEVLLTALQDDLELVLILELDFVNATSDDVATIENVAELLAAVILQYFLWVHFCV